MNIASSFIAATMLIECPPFESAVLTSPAPANSGGFASALVLADPLLFVGEPQGEGRRGPAGVVRIFERTGTSWELATTIPSPNATATTSFGAALAFSAGAAELLVVGAPGDDTDAANAGRAFVFVRDRRGDWMLEATLKAPSPAMNQFFGWAVGAHDNSVIVGAPLTNTAEGGAVGVAYAFERSRDGSWTFVGELHPQLGEIPDGGGFGSSIAVDGDFAIIGAPYIGAEPLPGHVSFFQRLNGVWHHEQTSEASIQGNRDRFGSAVSVLGNVAVAGAPRDLPPNLGTIAIFRRTGIDPHAPWEAIDQVPSSQPEPFDRFGAAVCLTPHSLVVGASTQHETGMVYLYERDGSALGAETPLEPENGQSFDLYGVCLAIDSQRLIVGSPQFDSIEMDSGAAYIYELDGPPADLDGDCHVGAADLALLLGAWNSSGPLADLNGDAEVNAEDLAILLASWSGR